MSLLGRVAAFPRLAYAWYDAAYAKSPMIVSGLTMGFKAGLCDIAAQKIARASGVSPPSDHRHPKPGCQEDSSGKAHAGGSGADSGGIDFARVAKFVAFNIFYEGSFQHVLFNVWYPRMFPGGTIISAMKMAVFDNLVHTPFLYLPTYYAFKAVVVDGTQPKDGLVEYYREGMGVVVACWTVWVPAQVLIFWKVPPNFRIVTTAVFGTVWDVILSYMAPMSRLPPSQGRAHVAVDGSSGENAASSDVKEGGYTKVAAAATAAATAAARS